MRPSATRSTTRCGGPTSSSRLTGDSGPPAIGNKVSVVARGFLPYKLRFTLQTIEVEEPTRLKSVLRGDFEGTGEWRLHEEDGNTIAELDWRPIVNKSFVKSLTPVLRPLFRSTTTGRCSEARSTS